MNSQLENTTEDWISLGDFAKVINRSYHTCLKLVARKAVLAHKRGGQWTILASEVRRFLQQGNHPDCLPPGAKSDGT